MAVKILKENPGFVEDTAKGLVIPAGMAVINSSHAFDDPNVSFVRSDKVVAESKSGEGTSLAHDQETGIPYWPAYASGYDDRLMRALVRGHMANSGQTPVLISMLSTIVAKRQAMAGTWTTAVRGRRSPVRKVLDLMAMADDFGLGPTEFVQNFIGALDTDNRGAIVAQVPFHKIEFDRWGEYGMQVEPVLSDRPGVDTGKFVLTMTSDDFNANRGVWTVDGLQCLPTGNKEYPFWFATYSKERKGLVWVLIPRDFGFQITQHSGGKDNLYPGFGQSGSWRFSPYAIKYMMIDRMDWEHLMAQPMRGIVWATGLDAADQFKQQITQFNMEKDEEGLLVYPGVFFGGTVGENSKVLLIPWSEPPAGYTPSQWTDEVVSGLASSFHMNETHLRLKLGEGALTQSGVAEALEAETSISWMRHIIEQAWNHVAPPRVMVSVIWQSDRTLRWQVETFRELSLAISRLQKQYPGAEQQADVLLTNDQIRAMITETIGLDIPDTDSDQETATTKEKGEDIPARMWNDKPITTMLIKRGEEILYKMSSGPKYGTFIRESGSGLCWVNITDMGDMLVPMESVFTAKERHIDHGHEYHEEPPIYLRRGSHHYNSQGAPIVITFHDGRHVGYHFAWEDGRTVAKTMLASDVIVLNFETNDEPPPPASEAKIDDPDERIRKALDEWIRIHFDGAPPEGTWEWNETTHTYDNTETGESLTLQQMVELRDDFADGIGAVYSELPAEDGSDDDKDDSDLSLVALLLLGRITLAEFIERLRSALMDASIAQYIFGLGLQELSADDLARIEDFLTGQFAYLDDFAQDIASGALSEAVIAWRVSLYFSAIVAMFDMGRLASFSYDMMLPAMPGDGSSECFFEAYRVRVFTRDDGYKRLTEVQAGEFVLTHRGRFKQVIEPTERYVENVEAVTITVDLPDGKVKTTVTPSHLFQLADGAWIYASDIVKGDELMRIGRVCARDGCGKVVPLTRGGALRYCSNRCAIIGEKKWEKAIELHSKLHKQGKGPWSKLGAYAKNHPESCSKGGSIGGRVMADRTTGKTYEELYGENRAEEIKDRIGSHKRGKSLEDIWNSPEDIAEYKERLSSRMKVLGPKIRKLRRPVESGYTYEERYGEEKAKRIKAKIRKRTKRQWDEDRESLIVAQVKGMKNGRHGLDIRTKPEIAMANILSDMGLEYEEQVWFLGRYCVDFVLTNYDVIIEADGNYWHNYPDGLESDEIRDEEIYQKKGCQTLRFWESDILNNPEKVKETINRLLDNHDHHYIPDGRAVVMAVSKETRSGKVNCLVVEDDESFVITNGLISHNCGSHDRCYWEIIELEDRITAKWIRTARESCATCIGRSRCPALIFIKATGEHINFDCY